MNKNPFCYLTKDSEPILELKTGIVLYLEDPPGPIEARKVYDLYKRNCGNHIHNYCTTAPGSIAQRWNSKTQRYFENNELPALRKHQIWGYGFDDGNVVDSWLFMFHGYRPYQESGKASFYRFSFPWNVDLDFLHYFAEELITHVPCLSGFGGYYFQGSITDMVRSYDQMFSLAHQYWGIEAHNLDVSVNHMLRGYKCVNWLTIIGNKFRMANKNAIQDAKLAAFAYRETNYAVLLQAEAKPRFGDRNKQEVLEGYISIAQALLPLQITEHASLGGYAWDEDNTMRYIRRFTHPQEMCPSQKLDHWKF